MRSTLLALSALIPLSGCGSSLGISPGAPDGGAEAQRPRYEDYIRGDRFPKLILEVDSVPGYDLRPSTETAVVSQLGALIDKPGGISTVRDDALASRGADHPWTFAELTELADATFDVDAPADTTKMHLLFVDGHYAEDTSSGKVLGIAWAHTHLVMFEKSIEDACRGGLSGALSDRLCENAEHGVLIHEMGHLLGLVDNGLPMLQNHRDPDAQHGAHDANQGCVMYWAYDTGTVVDDLRDRLLGGDESKLDFDQACKDDVAAVRNR